MLQCKSDSKAWCNKGKDEDETIAYLSIPIGHWTRNSWDERHIAGLRRAIPSPFAMVSAQASTPVAHQVSKHTRRTRDMDDLDCSSRAMTLVMLLSWRSKKFANALHYCACMRDRFQLLVCSGADDAMLRARCAYV